MTWPLGHTFPCCLSRFRNGNTRSTRAKNMMVRCLPGSGGLVEPELEHVDVALRRDCLGGDLRRVVGDEVPGHEEVVVAPAVLSVRFGHLPLPDLLAVDVDVADLFAEDRVEPLDDDEVLAGPEVVRLP